MTQIAFSHNAGQYNWSTEPRLAPAEIVKRDGRVVPFDASKIEQAITKCFASLGTKPKTREISHLAWQVVSIIRESMMYRQIERPTVEQVQNTVETVLHMAGELEAARHYILYRAEHERLRLERPIPDTVREAFDESARYFPTPLQQFQFYDKYSRYNYDLGRRETWVETVDRAVAFLAELSHNRLSTEEYEHIRRYMLEMKAMCSLRLLAMAGPAARRSNIATYNCSYLHVDSLDAFVEALIISMNGCGVGFSVEREHVEKLPRVQRQRGGIPQVVTVDDSSEGWADALRFGLEAWVSGFDVRFDYSEIRPAGTPLKIKGGRASGPDPLEIMLDFVRARILARAGSVLRPIDAHDIMCAVGSAAVSGGHRRTAMLSLFDFDDLEMRRAKSGDFERLNNQRWNANNSAVWTNGQPGQLDFMHQFLEMVESGRGEPGVFSRDAAILHRPSRRKEYNFGCNPCAEIALRSNQFCNLSIAVARPYDTFDSLREKVAVATLIGTIQSMATHFPGLRPTWKENCEEERLLGVDITGQMDSETARDPNIQRILLLATARQANSHYAEVLGINRSAAITCVKPSGNSSTLFDCAPGIHTRWAPYYVRHVRVSAHTPIYKVLRDAGVPMNPENGQTAETASTWVIPFPVKAPRGAILRKDRTALEQCEYWLQVKEQWAEHSVSCTVTYKEDEVLDLMKWVWEHRNYITGLSFLPWSDAKYAQMPYVEITEDEYEKRLAAFPEIDFAKIFRYEHEDLTNAAQELACVAGLCEIDYSMKESRESK